MHEGYIYACAYLEFFPATYYVQYTTTVMPFQIGCQPPDRNWFLSIREYKTDRMDIIERWNLRKCYDYGRYYLRLGSPTFLLYLCLSSK